MAKANIKTLPGAKWRQTHQVTVDAVLGADPNSDKYRRVRSQGSQFLNRDKWYARTFAGALCEWARLNKEVQPTEWDVRRWLSSSEYTANTVYDRGITIAETPDDLDQELAMALVGGAYHEAWHTEYSRRRPISLEEVWPRVQQIWGLIPWAPERGFRGWSKLTQQLLTWSNIVEDIRIERLGNREFPGAPEKMEALQDLILKMESGIQKEPGDSSNFLSVVQGAFRDLGLGYETSLQRQTLEKYQVHSLEGWNLVTKGKLRPLLDRAIALTREDDLGSLWLAMEIVATLAEIAAPEAAKKWAEKNEKKEEASPEKPSETSKEEPRKVDQADATPDEDEAQDSSQSPIPVITEKPPVYKVGDQVQIQVGPYAGARAQVVRASLPDPVTGIQDLEFALVEED